MLYQQNFSHFKVLHWAIVTLLMFSNYNIHPSIFNRFFQSQVAGAAVSNRDDQTSPDFLAQFSSCS